MTAAPAASPPHPPRTGLVSAVLDVFRVLYEPGAVFERLRERPRVLVPMITVVVLSLVLGLLTLPFVEAAIGAVLAQRGGGASPMSPDSAALLQVVSSAVFLPLVMLVGAGFLWIAVSLFGADARYRTLLSVQSHAMILYILQTALGLLVLHLRGVESVTSPQDLQPAFGLDLLAPETRGYLGAVLKGVNVFSVWGVIVQGIGITRTHGTSRETGYGAAAVASVAALLLFSLLALLQPS